MRISLLGGLRVEHEGQGIPLSGSMQLAVFFRLAVDAGTSVSYRAIAEDIWGMDAPENQKAALQSIVSRLRAQLPPETISSTPGGYRLNVARGDVDALAFGDAVASADSPTLFQHALSLWTGEPWMPSQNFDWFARDLAKDHARALEQASAHPVIPPHPTLPAPLTSLVGRDTELSTLADQVAGNRLVTLIGTGGAGKTRLALEAAARFGDALLVELAPAGPSEVVGAVLTATGRELRTTETAGDSSRTRVLEALAGRSVLLVLDNCEHVIDAAAALAQDLLSALPQLRILATSREPLGVPGEAFVGLGPLPHPADAEIDGSTSSELARIAAVDLFAQRSRSATGRALPDHDLGTAARICTRLDGLPLAIELAAAKLRTMEPAEVLAGLDHRFTLLTGGYRTAMPRHQTLKAMIDWSWSLLDDPERHALLSLSVFPAGVGVGDASALASALGLPGPAVFDSLVDRSLLQRIRGRYRALETIREYGLEWLAADGGLTAARTAHATFIAQRAADNDPLLRTPGIMQAIEWFDAEEDNVASALRYARDPGGADRMPLADIGVRLTISCTWYWVLRDRNEEGAMWLRTAAQLAAEVTGSLDPSSAVSEETKLLALLGPLLENFSGSDDDDVDVAKLAEQLHRLEHPLHDLRLGAGSHEVMQLIVPGLLAFAASAGSADWLADVRLPSGEELGLDPWPTAMLHVMRAGAAQNRGAVEELGEESQTALLQFTEHGDLWGRALAQRMRAEWLTLHGRLDEALHLADSSTDTMRSISSTPDLAREQGLSLQLLARLGRGPEAHERVAQLERECAASGDARATLQVQINALMLDVTLGDTGSAGIRLAAIDELSAFSKPHPQTTAVLATAKAALARLLGDLPAAERHLRATAEAALRSRDQPIIGNAVLEAGMLALAYDDTALARRAAALATAIIGADDPTHPVLAAIAAADAAPRRDAGLPAAPPAHSDARRQLGLLLDSFDRTPPPTVVRAA